jgi:hypothetical protein
VTPEPGTLMVPLSEAVDYGRRLGTCEPGDVLPLGMELSGAAVPWPADPPCRCIGKPRRNPETQELCDHAADPPGTVRIHTNDLKIAVASMHELGRWDDLTESEKATLARLRAALDQATP